MTNGSTALEGIVNPLIAACDAGFVPDTIYMLSNPGVRDEVAQALKMMTVIVEAYGETPAVEETVLSHETEFDQIATFFQKSIETVQKAGGEVAVNVTPGRKFMSAIAFQAGLQRGADHVYYLHMYPNDYYGQLYPDIPRSALDLIDFQEMQA